MAVKLFYAKIYAEIYTVYDQHSKMMFYFSTGSHEIFFYNTCRSLLSLRIWGHND